MLLADGPGRSRNNKARLLALLMAVTRWAEKAELRTLFPHAARSRLHAAKKWLFGRHVRFVFDRGDATDVVRLVVTGAPFANWQPALVSVETWQAVPQVAEVILKLDDSPLRSLPPPARPGTRTLVLPLREDAIAACAPGLGLFPSANALAILRDKLRFADYVTANGLAGLCPRTYRRPEEIELPCIAKPTYDLGRTVVARTREELDALLAGSRSLPPRLTFQEFIPGPIEYSIHGIARKGRPVCSYGFRVEKDGDAQFALQWKAIAPSDPPPAALDALERLLRPLDYDGPYNMDYMLRPSGEIAVFEINPRFGGTMFLPENRSLLIAALTCLIAEARSIDSRLDAGPHEAHSG